VQGGKRGTHILGFEKTEERRKKKNKQTLKTKKTRKNAKEEKPIPVAQAEIFKNQRTAEETKGSRKE